MLVGCSSDEVSDEVAEGEGPAEEVADGEAELDDEDDGGADDEGGAEDDGAVEDELEDEEPTEESDEDDEGLADGETGWDESRPPLEEVDDVSEGGGVTGVGGRTPLVGEVVGLVVPMTGGAELAVDDDVSLGLNWGKPPPIRDRASSAILTRSSRRPALSTLAARATIAWCRRGSLGAFATVAATRGSTYSRDTRRIVSVDGSKEGGIGGRLLLIAIKRSRS